MGGSITEKMASIYHNDSDQTPRAPEQHMIDEAVRANEDFKRMQLNGVNYQERSRRLDEIQHAIKAQMYGTPQFNDVSIPPGRFNQNPLDVVEPESPVMASYAAPPQTTSPKPTLSAEQYQRHALGRLDADHEKKVVNTILRYDNVDLSDGMTSAKAMLLDMSDFAKLYSRDDLICDSED